MCLCLVFLKPGGKKQSNFLMKQRKEDQYLSDTAGELLAVKDDLLFILNFSFY